MIPGCSQSGLILSCTSCQSNYYIKNGQCVPFCSDHYFSEGQICQKCDPSCYTCKDASPTSCLICESGRFFFLDNTCITCDQNSGYLISENRCVCQEGYEFSNSICEKLKYLVYESSFSPSQIEQIQEQVNVSSKTVYASTTFLSFLQNFLSQSSFGVAVNGLTCMKLSQITLVNILLPNQIYTPLSEIKSQCPPSSYKFLNFFEQLFNQSSNQFQNSRYQEQNISFDLLYTSGQGVVMISACTFVLTIFYFLLEKCEKQYILSASRLIFDKVLSGSVIQFLQLGVAILIIGINQQIKSFFLQLDTNKIGVSLTYLIIFILVVLGILYWQYLILNRNKENENLFLFNEITRKKIQNETIFESKKCRNFMIIYLFYESIFMPICYMSLSENWFALSIASIVFQSVYFCIIIYLKPFHSKLTNSYFIIDSILWLSLYIQYLILNIFTSQYDLNENAQFLDNLSYSFLLTFQLILFELTIYMVLNLIVELISFLIKKKKQKQNQNNAPDNILGKISKLEISETILNQNISNMKLIRQQFSNSTKIKQRLIINKKILQQDQL